MHSVRRRNKKHPELFMFPSQNLDLTDRPLPSATRPPLRNDAHYKQTSFACKARARSTARKIGEDAANGEQTRVRSSLLLQQ